MLLEDEELEGDIRSFIKDNKASADRAIFEVIEQYAKMMAELDDPYLRERATDFRDIGTRLVKNVLGIAVVNLSTIDEEVILVAKDLTPSETAQINLKYVLGFVTDIGGRTSTPPSWPAPWSCQPSWAPTTSPSASRTATCWCWMRSTTRSSSIRPQNSWRGQEVPGPVPGREG